MTLNQIKALLKSTGFPFAYRAFKSAQNPPFICYYETISNNFLADGKVYFAVKHIIVELYTKEKDQNTEAVLEKALASFIWLKDESFIENEKVFKITYEFEV